MNPSTRAFFLLASWMLLACCPLVHGHQAPGWLAPTVDVEAAAASAGEENWSVHMQNTNVLQGHAPIRSPYSGKWGQEMGSGCKILTKHPPPSAKPHLMLQPPSLTHLPIPSSPQCLLFLPTTAPPPDRDWLGCPPSIASSNFSAPLRPPPPQLQCPSRITSTGALRSRVLIRHPCIPCNPWFNSGPLCLSTPPE